MAPSGRPRTNRDVLVVGHGMVGHRLVEALRARDTNGLWQVTVLAEEANAAYDQYRSVNAGES